ncbi:histidinol-phosphatase HisJ family protein [Aquisalibacillus elongatus]|uniref:Histidinol-phosphatase n=1 Tax=Aquisalibacillus elongatus TaxID=485577 RepID=A0A3N5C494_9BACI|nr:histidinol-phosphatase HisJ family protein [Aquisalibacillus elongatus]RPF57058.1 histidinol-phosphatase (PHP family) [Aquisalibacillus elongatus]
MHDNHMHSTFSADCEARMEDMAEAAIKRGLTSITLTDHIDYDYPDPTIEFDVDLEAYEKVFQDVKQQYADRLTIHKGIELGIQPHLVDSYKTLTESNHFDFIILSMHTTDRKDLHSGKLFEDYTIDEAYEKYYTELLDCVKDYDAFSILGHLDLVTRYKYEEGVHHFHEVIEEIFKTIIPRGQGIEINTSGYKYNMNRLLPSKDILQLYYDMGGEIITVGSDAHKPVRVGDRIDEAYNLLKDIGFKYVSTFKDRKPVFHKL